MFLWHCIVDVDVITLGGFLIIKNAQVIKIFHHIQKHQYYIVIQKLLDRRNCTNIKMEI